MVQVGRKHQELLQRVEDENVAQARLTLELHKAEGKRQAGRWHGLEQARQGSQQSRAKGRVGIKCFKACVKIKQTVEASVTFLSGKSRLWGPSGWQQMGSWSGPVPWHLLPADLRGNSLRE